MLGYLVESCMQLSIFLDICGSILGHFIEQFLLSRKHPKCNSRDGEGGHAEEAHYEVLLLYNVVSATVFNILNYTFSNSKAHYVIMNNKVLSLIKEAEAHYRELEEDRLLRLMLLSKI